MTLFDNICKVKFEIGDANRPGDRLTTFKAGRLGLSEISDKNFWFFYISDFQHLNPNWNPQFQVSSILGSDSSSIKLPKLETKLTRFNMASRKKNDITHNTTMMLIPKLRQKINLMRAACITIYKTVKTLS